MLQQAIINIFKTNEKIEREIDTRKNQQALKLKNIIIRVKKNSLDVLTSRTNMTGERINKLDDRTVDIA